ncbi:hypothetical protein VaNZ11_003134 [Volvox africanus]|uniref:Uncharacterized protein n=1 Tax=Volvox africanus TaxID=51714 RepID=A0ABQ5RTH8_9CHLO|nr:hypothetical protein VaNZ11_003134 [Volvox africanus]
MLAGALSQSYRCTSVAYVYTSHLLWIEHIYGIQQRLDQCRTDCTGNLTGCRFAITATIDIDIVVAASAISASGGAGGGGSVSTQCGQGQGDLSGGSDELPRIVDLRLAVTGGFHPLHIAKLLAYLHLRGRPLQVTALPL